MKTRFIWLLTGLLFIGSTVSSQKITGQYYGIGNVSKDGNFSQYLSELILVQKGNNVTGEYNYYFKSAYVPSRVSGYYNSETRVLQLKVFPLLNYKAANTNGADCPMKGYFTLIVSKVEAVLSGQFETTDHYKYTCPDIVLKLKKEVLTPEQKKKLEDARNKQNIAKNKSDTNNEEELAAGIAKAKSFNEVPTISTQTKKQAVIERSVQTTGTKPASQIINENPAKTASLPDTTGATANNPIAAETPVRPAIKPATVVDTNKAGIAKVNVLARQTPTIEASEAITKNLITRTFDESPVIEVDADSLVVSLYDNGEVDGDTIALFHNRKLIVMDQKLSDKSINITIPIDTTIHEISMYAENLGAIPPNTAACIIMAGQKRYELILTSNFMRNAAIRFRKKTQEQLRKEKELL